MRKEFPRLGKEVLFKHEEKLKERGKTTVRFCLAGKTKGNRKLEERKSYPKEKVTLFHGGRGK